MCSVGNYIKAAFVSVHSMYLALLRETNCFGAVQIPFSKAMRRTTQRLNFNHVV
jgi:hypothetical protein